MSDVLQPKVIVDLSATVNGTQVVVTNTKGTGFVVPAATDTTAGAMTSAQSTKLTGIATGATANSTDAQLRDRTTHTGAQAISTVTGLQTALDAKSDTTHVHGVVTTTVNGFASAVDKVKLDGIASGATANSTDAQLRDRTTHTGAQAISTVTGLQTALDAKAALTQTLVIGSDNWLKIFAKDYELLLSGTITRDANNVVTTSGVVWPDGVTGTFTATTINATFKCVDAYTITYVGGTTKTVTQPAVTRNASGYVVTYPVATVA
jgi:hypothetical protein